MHLSWVKSLSWCLTLSSKYFSLTYICLVKSNVKTKTKNKKYKLCLLYKEIVFILQHSYTYINVLFLILLTQFISGKISNQVWCFQKTPCFCFICCHVICSICCWFVFVVSLNVLLFCWCFAVLPVYYYFIF